MKGLFWAIGSWVSSDWVSIGKWSTFGALNISIGKSFLGSLTLCSWARKWGSSDSWGGIFNPMWDVPDRNTSHY